MVNELKYILLGLLLTIVVFAAAAVLATAIKYFPDVTVVVGLLALSYWASRMVKDYYEN